MFNINGEEWHVLLVSPYHPKLQRSNGLYSVGACDDITKTIYINENLENSFLKKVLCHEITHAAMFSYNVELNLDQEELLAEIIATYGQEIIHITNLLFKRLKDKTNKRDSL